MKKTLAIIVAVLVGFGAAMISSPRFADAAKGTVIYAKDLASNAVITAKIAAKSVTVVKIQGGAVGTVPLSDADGGVAWGVAPTGATGATGATGTVGTSTAGYNVCWLTGTTLGKRTDGGACN